MHRLVPTFITDNLRQNNLQGTFACSALFVDISGFTYLTENLMAFGQHGAEVLANVMRTVFSPLVHNVFEHGGFVTNFAGDAFTAVFPEEEGDSGSASLNALAAAWQIQIDMAQNARQNTRYGSYEFSAKVGVAAGETNWGIILSDDGGQAAYYFKGTAIDRCVAAQELALAGDVIIDAAVYEAAKLRINVQPAGDCQRVTRLTATLPEPLPVNLPPPDVEKMSLFMPRLLFEQQITGEFRQILSLFISLRWTPGHEELSVFMQHLFLLQRQYGGVLNRIDYGDKGCHLLLFWGAPTSFENDLTRVLDFMLELLQVSNIPLKAGVTYRISHAGCSGSSLAEEYTCYGRGVNLAARYMVAAEWDEIWLDGETARRAETEFHIRSLGFKNFKGIEEPQPIYRLDGWRERTVSPFGAEPIVGRRQEIRQLKAAVQPIFEGQFAGVMIVYGDAGLGKSRLVHAFLDETAGSKQAEVFICRTDEILRQSLNPFRYFLRHYFDQSNSQDEMTNKRRFGQILAGLLWSIPDEDLKAELDRTHSFLGSMLGLHWKGSLYEQLEPELRFENTLDALKALFKAESLNRPVIILLEDGHWLDDDSREFLEHLTRNVDDYPLALLITSRGFVADSMFDPDAPKHRLKLEPLGKENIAEMAEFELGRKPSAALVRLLNERTDGNPFYVQQMLLYLRENNLLEAVDKQVGTTLLGDVYVPTDVRTLLTARLDCLPTAVRDVVQKAAVLGREFEIPILTQMVDDETDLTFALEAGDKEEIWVALSDKQYLFHHALLRDAAYDMQLQSRLRQLHHQAANAFEEQMQQEPTLEPRYPVIAYHFDRAGKVDQARSYYGEAGDQAKENFRNEESIVYFSRALDLTDESDDQSLYRFLLGRETIYQWEARREEQKKDLERLAVILKEHPDDLRQAELTLRQSAFALVNGDYESAVSEAQRSLEFAKQAGDTVATARAYHRWGRTLWQQGLGREAETILIHALDLAREGQALAVEAECLYDVGMVYRMQSRYSEAEEFLQRASAAYEELGDEQGLIRCQNLFGLINIDLGQFGGANYHYLQALELCQKFGWRYAETTILLNIGILFSDLGDYESARAYHKKALGLSREIGDRHSEAVSLDSLGLISFYEDRLPEAITNYEQALALREIVPNQRSKGFVLTHLGYALALSGKYEAARSCLTEALEIRKELNEEALTMDSLAGLALVSLLQGEQQDALSQANDILSWFENNSSEGIEFPVQVYFICYQVFDAAAQNEPQLLPMVESVLQDGYALLQERLIRIRDEQMREQFKENVPYNRLLQAAWLSTQSPDIKLDG